MDLPLYHRTRNAGQDNNHVRTGHFHQHFPILQQIVLEAECIALTPDASEAMQQHARALQVHGGDTHRAVHYPISALGGMLSQCTHHECMTASFLNNYQTLCRSHILWNTPPPACSSIACFTCKPQCRTPSGRLALLPVMKSSVMR